MEEYLIIAPSGELRKIETERERMVETFYKVIGCDCVECVRTVVPDVCLIVDESGKIKTPPQRHNERASQLYYGYIAGQDDIAAAVDFDAVSRIPQFRIDRREPECFFPGSGVFYFQRGPCDFLQDPA